MDTAQDPIKALIETTGLSCDDLLEKLLQYKNHQKKVSVQTKETDLPDNGSGNGDGKAFESTTVISEKASNSPHSDDTEIPSVYDAVEQEPPSHNRKADVSNENHHQRISQDLEKSNASSGTKDTTAKNSIPIVEHKKETTRVPLKYNLSETQENVKTTLSKSPTISKNLEKCDEKIGETGSNSNNERKISNESLSQNQHFPGENIPPIISTEPINISKKDEECDKKTESMGESDSDSKERRKSPNELLSQNPHSPEKIVTTTSLDPIIISNNNMELDDRTEGIGESDANSKDIKKISKEPCLKNQNVTTTLSKLIHISKNGKEYDDKIENIADGDCNSKDEQKISNEPLLQNQHFPQENVTTALPEPINISKNIVCDEITENISDGNCNSKYEKEILTEPSSQNLIPLYNSSQDCGVDISRSKQIYINRDSNQLISVNNAPNENQISQTFQYTDQSDTISTDNTMNFSSRRKSISDELVLKLAERVRQYDEISNSVQSCEENDIEVCQIEENEVSENLSKPMLKLRSDLFANNSKGNFIPSDDEDENSPEMKEFLKNIEEVTGEVENPATSRSPLEISHQEAIRNSPPRVRQVRSGFVKKRILHKAIKCINGVEAKKIGIIIQKKRFFVSQKPNCENEAVNGKHVTEEEIRENLKLQLTSLRNRKKGSLIKDKCNINNLIINYDKHTFDKKKASKNRTDSTDHVESSTTIDSKQQNDSTNITDSSMNNTDSENKESLFSLSNDTNFVILDVQGGVEFSDITETVEKTEKAPTEFIKLTKTNDVTKIKGWQNKKFQLHQEKNPIEESNETDIHTKEDMLADISMPSCSNINSGKSNTGITEKLSPFVSNSLEEFLTENSTLNISYKIPKLGAVQNINNKSYDTVELPHNSECINSESEKKKERFKSIKPKTLAEKRRMLENSQSKVLNEEKLFNKLSYVLYNGHKLYVPSTKSEQCIVNVEYRPKSKAERERINKTSKNKKISLLDTYHQSSSCVSYKPGPLREKRRLQNRESLSDWDTQIRRLPPIKLNVVMEVGKPVAPHLVHYFNFDTKINEDRLELALSALSNGTEQQKQGFSLTVPYVNKQKFVLVRKKKQMPHNVVYDITPEKNTIESILDDLISYVEIKENENSNIRDAEIYEQEGKHEKEVKISTEVSPAKKAKDRRLKTEISRLSCKVLSVSFNETEDIKKCSKTFCKLGCVCKSLACVPQLPMHCGKMQCMFECKCSASENVSIGVETGGSLTRDTVTRLEDQVKKNLARVEKEFTQTIIHANDQTILIPSSDRSKAKRIKRMPKRYSDFLEDFEDEILSSPNEIEEYNLKKISNCFVTLQKLNINGIIPLCLYHDCYNCACMDIPDKKPNTNPQTESQEVVQKKIDKKRKHSPDKTKKSKTKESKLISVASSSGYNTSDSDHYMEEIQLFNKKKAKVKEGCARHIGVHPEIVARNEIPFYKSKIKSKVIQAENSTFFETTEHISYTEPFTESIDIITPLTILASDRLKSFILTSRKRKRKQSFDDVDPKHRSKKLKLKEVHPESVDESCDNNSKHENLPYSPVFEGEIIVPTNENEEFVKKLGMKSAAQYMRLLPWNDLLINYYNHKINIWCNDSYNKLLMNIKGVKPPEGYVEITESNRKNGIMNWILTKKLPKETPSELVHLILSPKNKYFEISGICLKNTTEEEKHEKTIHTEKNETSLEPSMTLDKKKQSSDLCFFEHKNHNNETQRLTMTQKEYTKQLLCVHSCSEQENVEQLAPLYVRVPSFKSLRWRMLFLNSNFTFLSFEKSGYSIKYTDLMNVLKKAQCSNKTICLRSKSLSKGYSQKNFGIYAVPKFLDILFIGPYGMDEGHGLQTLRYLRQELVSTTYFELVQGGVIPNKKKDMWLISKSFAEGLNEIPHKDKKKSCGTLSPQKFKQDVINSEYAVLTPLHNTSTSPSPDSKNFDLELKSDTAQEVHNFHSHLFYSSGNLTTSEDLEERTFVKFPHFIILNGKTLRPLDYNGYLSTNIPGFGYLGAIIDYRTKETEVNWPFGNKVLRFANVLYAKQFIKRRFANLLLPVPATFNLQILMKNDIENLKNMSPVDPKFLNGTHVCGSFGVLDSRKLTPSLAQTLGTTQEDVLQRLAKRAQFLVRCRLRTLGLFLLPKDEQLEEVLDNVAHLSKLGNLEIEKLKAQEKVLIQSKKELIMRKQKNLKKYMDLLMTLPEEQRLELYAKFRHEFNRDISNNAVDNIPSDNPQKSEEEVECIEIDDSDSEEDKSLGTEKPIKPSENSPKISFGASEDISVEFESSGEVENFRLVKTPTGKMVLMEDKSGASLSRTLTGMKMKISNNRVMDDKT